MLTSLKTQLAFIQHGRNPKKVKIFSKGIERQLHYSTLEINGRKIPFVQHLFTCCKINPYT